MTSRTVRSVVVVVVLLVGVAGAYLGYDTARRHNEVFTQERALLVRLDAMLASVNELAVTQRGYFEPSRAGSGGGSSAQFERVRRLTEELKDHLASLRTQVSEPEAVEQTTVLAAALDAFATTDTRVRTNLANDTYFSAADLVFSASATELRSVTGALIALKGLSTRNAVATYDRLQRRSLMVAGTVGLVWTAALLLLAWPPKSARASGDLDGSAAIPAVVSLEAAETPVIAGAPPLDLPQQPVSVDLEAAARTCSAMARASSAAELREGLAEAASALGANGLVIWLGAGEELFPVLGHGYDPRMLSRIGPLSRNASNATAIAWRNAATEVVRGEQARAGAIVAPLISSQGCIGVLSAEVTSGRETDTATRAVTELFAAQLSTIVAAWPEPSAGATEHSSDPGTIAVTL
jgi:CHASE3 domain sensor protein